MKRKKLRHSLVYGTALLFASNVLVKGLGFYYRVALVRLLGAEGIGLVEMVTPVYSFLLVLAGLGLQPALAQSVAGDRSSSETSFSVTRRLLLLSGLGVSLVAAALAPKLALYFAADPRVETSLLAVTPAVFIVSLASAWRGWFQGRRDLGVLGMSQNTEQVARVALGLYLVPRLLALGLEQGAAGVSLATVGGELAGFLYLALTGSIRRRKPVSAGRERRHMQAARRLLSYGLPMTGGRLVNSALLMLQAYLIPFCLQTAGCSVSAATEIYGRFSGVALTLLHLPGVFASALATAVMPAVAENAGAPEALQPYIQRPLQATIICTLPGMTLLFLYAEPLCALLFHNAPAAPILRALAPGGIFFYLQMTLAGIIQGLGDVRRLLINNTVSGCLLLVGVVLLVPLPDVGIYGAALASDLAWLCGTLLHLATVRRHLRQGLPWLKIAGPPLLALAAAFTAWLICEKTAAGGGAWFSIAGAAVAYLLTLFSCGRSFSL